MKLLVLTVLLSVAQTIAPIPRQIPNSPASTSAIDQKNTDSKNKPTNSPSAINKNQSETADSDTAKQGNPDAQHSITISELPPVKINNRRDWADWGTWFFTFLLAFTGILQIILLWKTLKVTSKQAEIARNQETQMIQAGQQTERIIAQMKEAEVRDLRAYVGVSKVILNLQKKDVPKGIVEVNNFGKTPAYKVRQWVGIAIHSHPLTVVFPESPLEGASVSVIFPNIKNVNIVDLKKPLPPNTAIGTPQLTVYVYGKIIYEDIFQNERYSNYRFIFGGSQGGQVYRDDIGTLLGTMNPDSEGNNAT